MVGNDPNGSTMARRAVAVLLLLSMTEACASDVARVRGEVSWTTNGIAKIAECGTGRVLRVGTMASSPYFRFSRSYEELSGDGRRPVLVEVEGVIIGSSSSANELTIDQPRIIELATGRCDNASPGASTDTGRAIPPAARP